MTVSLGALSVHKQEKTCKIVLVPFLVDGCLEIRMILLSFNCYYDTFSYFVLIHVHVCVFDDGMLISWCCSQL